MSKILLQLSVPAYLKKILDVRFGELYKPREDNLFGMTILNVLKRKSSHDYQFRRNQYTDGKYRFKNANIPYFLNISVDQAKRRGFNLDTKRSFQIVKSIDRNLREELYIKAIFNKDKYGIDYQTTILDWLEMYDISEEELSYESLRKDFNRKRRDLMKKLNITA